MSRRSDRPFEYALSTVDLDLVHFVVEDRLAESQLRFNHKFIAIIDHATRHLVLSLRAGVYKRGPERISQAFEVRYPANWWEAFKARFWDTWWFWLIRQEHYPPQYTTETRTLTVEGNMFFPELQDFDMPKRLRLAVPYKPRGAHPYDPTPGGAA